MYQRGLSIFRQDLRLEDNTALQAVYNNCKEVIPLFIFDTDVLDRFPKPDARIGFLVDTLQKLSIELYAKGIHLLVFHGKSSDLIPLLAKELRVDALYRNHSYGSGSLTRDEVIRNWATKNDIAIHTYQDYLLVKPEHVQTRKVFTPFYHLRQQVPKRVPLDDLPKRSPTTQSRLSPSLTNHTLEITDTNKNLDLLGGTTTSYRSREHVIQMWDQLDLTSCDDLRNRPDLGGTSMFSPYLRFGVISPRQVLLKGIALDAPGVQQNSENMTITMDKKHFTNSFVSELAWREFRRHIDHNFPESRLVEFQEKRRGIQRRNNQDWFAARQESRTGYPIIDAGMRRLKAMNRMHGRVRMIVASFLCKDLLIDRKRGERHFADRLIDYDEAVNNGNWRWSASVGADPKPLRIFNPILQAQKFDPHAQYIKHRLPELAHHTAEQLHDPLTHKLDRHRPIVNHYKTSKIAKELYKKIPVEITLF